MDARNERLTSSQRDRLIDDRLKKLREQRAKAGETLLRFNLRLDEIKKSRDDAMMYVCSLDDEIGLLEQGQLPLDIHDEETGH
jgi:hypothetical protein